jgi:hypothetical protein
MKVLIVPTNALLVFSIGTYPCSRVLMANCLIDVIQL